MKYNFSLTTRTRLIIAFFLVALIPMGLLAVINGRATRQALIDDANQALFAVAQQTAASLDTFIANNLDAIHTVAQLPTLVEYLAAFPDGAPGSIKEEEVLILLNTLVEKSPYVTSYALLNNDGVVLVDTQTGEMGADKSNRDYFAFFKSPHEEDKAAQIYLERSARYMVQGVPPEWNGAEPVQ